MNPSGESTMWPAFLRPAPDSMAQKLRHGGSNPRLHALNLLWSLWIFVTPLVSSGVHASFWWSVAAGYPLFVLLFALVNVRPYREVNIYVAGMAMLAILSLPYNPSAWSYTVFACVYVPYEGSLRATGMRIATIVLVTLLEAWWLGIPWFAMVLMAAVCVSAASGSLAGRLNMQKNAAQRLSQDEVRRLAATAERERIGRDLHDLLGHTLSLITLKLELSRKLFDRDHEAARRELADAEGIARKALAEVRAAVTGIRATDLAAELASAHLMLETLGVVMRYEPSGQALPADIEAVLALVVREAVTNIARHAHATRADVEMSVERGVLHLCIRDDGRGGLDAFGNGLAGMRERVEALGGALRVDSPRDQGTTLHVTVPLPARDAAPRADTSVEAMPEPLTMPQERWS
ncbi:two-component system sensor histidine kinase DesK [Oleiagrimonas soli]|uniref:Two-component system sensor histidine kinase DesK n=2 Tax=Oleiagrimonas soli TaxID=1543381 RepID=A0A841KEC3_9GAMM|nr:two-component system sensor histidine kinase DesK [Oleiagrimonas soli]